MAIKKLSKLIELAQKIPKKRVVVAYGQDETTILATKRAIDLKIAEFTLIGDEKVIKKICADHDIDSSIYTIVHEPDEIAAGHTTMQLLSEGNGDVMMKGLISSDKFLKCMLDKEYGLMIPDAILTSVSIARNSRLPQTAHLRRCCFHTPPNIDQKIAMTKLCDRNRP